MEPYVVKQGDYLLKIAHRRGFDADAVWNDSRNAKLRALRPSPDVLFPGDILYVPDDEESPPTVHRLVTGATNEFTAPAAPTMLVSVKFVDDGQPRASQKYAVSELPDLTGLTTDGDGVATFPAPADLDVVTVVFADSGESWQLQIGSMDPLDTLSGIFKRLRHLGYIDYRAGFDYENSIAMIERLRAALLRFKADLGASSTSATGDDDSDTSSDDDSDAISAPNASPPTIGRSRTPLSR
jgi:hypothetical protein